MIFNFYKIRGFSEYMNDTLEFFKLFGSHFYINYIIINGTFLIVSSCLSLYFTKIYSHDFLSFISDLIYSTETAGAKYINSSNFLTFFGLMILFTILTLILAVAFPPLYMKLLEERGKTNFSTKELVTAIEKEVGRMIVFFSLSLIISVFFLFLFMVPMAFILLLTNSLWYGLAYLVIFVKFFYCLVFPFFSIALNDYLISKSGYFESLRNSTLIIKNNFSSILLSTFVVFIIFVVVSFTINILPAIIVLFSTNATIDTTAYYKVVSSTPIQILSSISWICADVFLFSFVVANQGIIYFSSIADPHKKKVKHGIEEIGDMNYEL